MENKTLKNKQDALIKTHEKVFEYERMYYHNSREDFDKIKFYFRRDGYRKQTDKFKLVAIYIYGYIIFVADYYGYSEFYLRFQKTDFSPDVSKKMLMYFAGHLHGRYGLSRKYKFKYLRRYQKKVIRYLLEQIPIEVLTDDEVDINHISKIKEFLHTKFIGIE